MTAKGTPLFGDDEATAMLAKALALHAFRNPLEDLHAGISPATAVGDFSDVKVVTPYGEIPWSKLSRISDIEMKNLMIEVVSTLFTLLVRLDDKLVQASVSALAYDDIVKWDMPDIREGLLEAIMHPSTSLNRDILQKIVSTIMSCERSRTQNTR